MDEQNVNLICPAGEELYFRNRKLYDPMGYKFDVYQATKTSCSNCKLRSKCLRNPNTELRQVQILFEKPERNITEQMKEKIDTPEGRKTYSKRLGIVEPVFGNIRACKKMDRFTLRGKIKVGIQWKLYCLVHNIEKILKSVIVPSLQGILSKLQRSLNSKVGNFKSQALKTFLTLIIMQLSIFISIKITRWYFG